MFKYNSFLVKSYVFLFAIALSGAVLFFSSNAFSATYICDTPEQKKVCTELLNQTEKEIANLNAELNSTRQEAASIERDKALLDLKIKQAQLAIKAREISIANLGKDIEVKARTIEQLNNQIEEGKKSLSQIIRQTRQLDDFSLPEILLSGEALSDSLADLDAFNSVQTSLKTTFDNLRSAKSSNELAKADLSQKKNQEIDTKVSIESEKRKVELNSAEKKKLLAINQNEQSSYQKIIADKAAEAAQIRAALFKLRDAQAIPFGTALDYANAVSKRTGVRPAFLLAIITQESSLGANVGSCYLSDTETGAGVRIASGVSIANVMKPTRDVAPFLDITKNAGRDPFKTPVSCPLSIGYGGAMGPAQFIPSTWKLFEKRIASSLGISSPDPWNAEHAFMASGTYLSDLGAISGSYTAERNAACRYYSGRACGLVTGNTTYGNSVMAKATQIQANIDILEGN